MKIKIRATITAALAMAALNCAALDSFAHNYNNPGRHDGPDDKRDGEGVEEVERKETGFFFHHRDRRPASAQFEEAGKEYLAGRLKSSCRKFDILVRSHPYSAEASRAQYNLGAILERRGKYNEAFDEYYYLLIYYPENAKAGVVLEHMFAIANWQLRRGKRSAAVKSFTRIAAVAPGWEKTPEALFLVGGARLEAHDWYEAADAFDTVSTDYPASGYALPAMVGHSDALHALSRKYREDEAIQNRAIVVTTGAITALPVESPQRSRLAKNLEDLVARRDARAYAIARFYDTRRFKPENAIAAYEDFLRQNPMSRYAEAARIRLETLRK